jgi:hypothetical protein
VPPEGEFLSLAKEAVPVPANLEPPVKGPYHPAVTGDKINPYLGMQLLMTLFTKVNLCCERKKGRSRGWGRGSLHKGGLTHQR